MRTLVFFLEEPSAREMLMGLLPKILPGDVNPRFIVFEGKQDMERQLEKRLRGWNVPESVFLVLRDQDSGFCEQIKERLVKICHDAGHPGSIVRIACRELESWYFGDLAAVEAGLNLPRLVHHSSKAKYRIPDGIVNPAVELTKLTDGVYQKVGGSRLIGSHLDLTRNTSRSFHVFLEGIRRLL